MYSFVSWCNPSLISSAASSAGVREKQELPQISIHPRLISFNNKFSRFILLIVSLYFQCEVPDSWQPKSLNFICALRSIHFHWQNAEVNIVWEYWSCKVCLHYSFYSHINSRGALVITHLLRSDRCFRVAAKEIVFDKGIICLFGFCKWGLTARENWATQMIVRVFEASRANNIPELVELNSSSMMANYDNFRGWCGFNLAVQVQCW